VTDRQLRFRTGDQGQLVIAAIFVFGKLVGDDRLCPVADSGSLPCLLRALVVTFFQQV
jgi:hypothetical protein